jgi:hypothetical protein
MESANVGLSLRNRPYNKMSNVGSCFLGEGFNRGGNIGFMSRDGGARDTKFGLFYTLAPE